jgi:GlpG protein
VLSPRLERVIQAEVRQIATFDDERSARLFADVLCARAIDTDVSRSKAGSWDVWVLEEQHVEASRAAYAAFDANPLAPEHVEAGGCVERKQRQQVVVERKSRHEVIEVRRRLPSSQVPLGRTTVALVIVCVAVFLIVQIGSRDDIAGLLYIGTRDEPWPFARVASGQVWRLITPIFLHMNMIHILFNMWMLVDIGFALEARLRAARYAGLIVVTAAFSNAAQYFVVGSPFFGGMSGVLYALFGYAWIRGRLDPTLGLSIPNPTVVALGIWMVLGFTGAVGNVANFAHLGGLVSGAVLGGLAALIARKR